MPLKTSLFYLPSVGTRADIEAGMAGLHARHETRLTELYAAESGRRAGDGVAFLRDIVIADSDAEADHLWQESSRFMAQAWFEPFGFIRIAAQAPAGRMAILGRSTGSFPTPRSCVRSSAGRRRCCPSSGLLEARDDPLALSRLWSDQRNA